MTTQTFVVNISNEPIVVRVAQAQPSVIRVVNTSFGQARITGGVPGTPGAPGAPGQDGASDAGIVAVHISDTTPHPVYDDLPSLTLLFENGLV